MLAVTTTDSLTLINPARLKKPSSTINTSATLHFHPSTTCWSIDNSVLYLASTNTFHSYHPSQNSLEEIFSAEDGPITNLISKENSTLIFTVGQTVYFLESCTTTPKLSQKHSSHESPINSLSISTDNTLLLSTSSNAVHIHNITLNNTNPTTTLRGLPSSRITTGLLHTHIRTRVLVGVGKQLLVYDTARPSAPLKTFTMEGEGEVRIITCSPFSKTLVAVVMGGDGNGTICLVDLEKEKGLFRTINTKVPITTLSFSPEGASIYAGTETGTLMVIDLRALDKPPSIVEISGEGSGGRIVAMSIQKKTAGAPISVSRKLPSTTTASPTTRRTVSASKPSTPAKRIVSTSRNIAATTKASKNGTPIASPNAPAIKKAFSPARSPLANSSNRKIPTSPSTVISAKAEKERTKDKDKLSTNTAVPLTSRTRTVSSTLRPSVAARTSRTGSISPKVTSQTSPKNPSTTSNATVRPPLGPAVGESISTAGSRRTRIKSTEGSGSVPAVPPLPKGFTVGAKGDSGAVRVRERTRTRSTTGSKTNTTPSPDLPGLGGSEGVSDDDGFDGPHRGEGSGSLQVPVMPGPAVKRGKGLEFGSLGLGVPGGGGESKGKSRSVEFDGAGSDSEDLIESRPQEDRDEGEEEEEGGDLSMQISPARRPRSQASDRMFNVNVNNTPTRSPHHHHHNSHSQSPQDLLRNIVHSVLSDFHLQTHREMTNLHLDLVRMGRGWRNDVREAVKEEMGAVMEEMVQDMKESFVREIRDGLGQAHSAPLGMQGDLRELREENRRLREENEKLKRVVVTSCSSGSASLP
ncbi:WD40 repeat-like protein [Marasmius fiardii PR-910]|nr:WD40 repeat-like protein [Marasmius fiardii PR-910]